jgi:hypothetical protein
LADAPETQHRETLVGLIERLTFHNADSGFAVLNFWRLESDVQQRKLGLKVEGDRYPPKHLKLTGL